MKKSYKVSIAIALVALVGLGVYSGTRAKPSAASVPVPAAPLVVVVPAREQISIVFNQAPLGELVAFVAAHAPSYRFLCDGLAGDFLSWAEYGLPADQLLASFLRVLSSSGYTVTESGAVFKVSRTAAEPSFQPVDFLSSGDKLFFQYQGVIYSADKMPVPVQASGGRWFALTPPRA